VVIIYIKEVRFTRNRSPLPQRGHHLRHRGHCIHHRSPLTENMSQLTPQRCQTNCTRKITLTPEIIYTRQIITNHDLQLRLPKIYTAAISIHATDTPLTSEMSPITPKRSLRECHRLGHDLQILRCVEE